PEVVVDDPRVVDLEPIGARDQRLVEAESGPPQLLVVGDAGDGHPAVTGAEECLLDLDLGGVEDDVLRRLPHLEVDPDLPREGEVLEVEVETDVVVLGEDVTWQAK